MIILRHLWILLRHYFHFPLLNHRSGGMYWLAYWASHSVFRYLSWDNLCFTLHYECFLRSAHLSFLSLRWCPVSTGLSRSWLGSTFMVHSGSDELSKSWIVCLIESLINLEAAGLETVLHAVQLVPGPLISWFFLLWGRHQNVVGSTELVFVLLWRLRILCFQDRRWH